MSRFFLFTLCSIMLVSYVFGKHHPVTTRSTVRHHRLTKDPADPTGQRHIHHTLEHSKNLKINETKVVRFATLLPFFNNDFSCELHQPPATAHATNSFVRYYRLSVHYRSNITEAERELAEQRLRSELLIDNSGLWPSVCKTSSRSFIFSAMRIQLHDHNRLELLVKSESFHKMFEASSGRITSMPLHIPKPKQALPVAASVTSHQQQKITKPGPPSVLPRPNTTTSSRHFQAQEANWQCASDSWGGQICVDQSQYNAQTDSVTVWWSINPPRALASGDWKVKFKSGGKDIIVQSAAQTLTQYMVVGISQLLTTTTFTAELHYIIQGEFWGTDSENIESPSFTVAGTMSSLQFVYPISGSTLCIGDTYQFQWTPNLAQYCPSPSELRMYIQDEYWNIDYTTFNSGSMEAVLPAVTDRNVKLKLRIKCGGSYYPDELKIDTSDFRVYGSGGLELSYPTPFQVVEPDQKIMLTFEHTTTQEASDFNNGCDLKLVRADWLWDPFSEGTTMYTWPGVMNMQDNSPAIELDLNDVTNWQLQGAEIVNPQYCFVVVDAFDGWLFNSDFVTHPFYIPISVTTSSTSLNQMLANIDSSQCQSSSNGNELEQDFCAKWEEFPQSVQQDIDFSLKVMTQGSYSFDAMMSQFYWNDNGAYAVAGRVQGSGDITVSVDASLTLAPTSVLSIPLSIPAVNLQASFEILDVGIDLYLNVEPPTFTVTVDGHVEAELFIPISLSRKATVVVSNMGESPVLEWTVSTPTTDSIRADLVGHLSVNVTAALQVNVGAGIQGHVDCNAGAEVYGIANAKLDYPPFPANYLSSEPTCQEDHYAEFNLYYGFQASASADINVLDIHDHPSWLHRDTFLGYATCFLPTQIESFLYDSGYPSLNGTINGATPQMDKKAFGLVITKARAAIAGLTSSPMRTVEYFIDAGGSSTSTAVTFFITNPTAVLPITALSNADLGSGISFVADPPQLSDAANVHTNADNAPQQNTVASPSVAMICIVAVGAVGVALMVGLVIKRRRAARSVAVVSADLEQELIDGRAASTDATEGQKMDE